ncbi:MAG: carboxypeptidase-like regulatory domain-containing protein, partial [Ferruginibacter sp.]
MTRPIYQQRRATGAGQLKRKAALSFLLLLFIGQQSFAQGIADVRGKVLSEKGAILQGATVEARNTVTNTKTYSVTDDNSIFLFAKL